MTQVKSKPQVELSWEELEEILWKASKVPSGRKVKNITLMNPKRIRFDLEG